jgi:hypothetical protein
MLMSKIYFSTYNLIIVLVLAKTPAMVEQNQNSRLQCSLHATMVVVKITTTCNLDIYKSCTASGILKTIHKT